MSTQDVLLVKQEINPGDQLLKEYLDLREDKLNCMGDRFNGVQRGPVDLTTNPDKEILHPIYYIEIDLFDTIPKIPNKSEHGPRVYQQAAIQESSGLEHLTLFIYLKLIGYSTISVPRAGVVLRRLWRPPGIGCPRPREMTSTVSSLSTATRWRTFFLPKLVEHFMPNCLTSYVTCTMLPERWAPYLTLVFKQEGKLENVKRHKKGDTIFELSWWKPRTDKSAGGLWGTFTVNNLYTAKVEFKDRSIIITQHLDVYVFLADNQRSVEAHVIRKTITDTYSPGVDPDGKPQFAHNIDENDTSEKIERSFGDQIWPELKDRLDEVKRRANAKSIEFKSIPVTDLDQFVFPGGKTFAYKDAKFSKHQDLVCSIRYTS
jgi:hypothetical protein